MSPAFPEACGLLGPCGRTARSWPVAATGVGGVMTDWTGGKGGIWLTRPRRWNETRNGRPGCASGARESIPAMGPAPRLELCARCDSRVCHSTVACADWALALQLVCSVRVPGLAERTSAAYPAGRRHSQAGDAQHARIRSFFATPPGVIAGSHRSRTDVPGLWWAQPGAV
jgi:hypothetical protein